jgi:hypothetical protein
MVALLAAAGAGAQTNTLSEAERKAGWRLLFDGKTLDGWDDPGKRDPAGMSWKVEDGWLVAQAKPRIREDLVTLKEFGDFELVFEWRIDAGTNSGVKYRVQRTVFLDLSKMPAGMESIQDQLAYEISRRVSDRRGIAAGVKGKDYSAGFEFQVIDDARHPDSKEGGGKHATGALYDLAAPASTPARGAGEINTGRIVARGGRVEHWINGVKVLEASLDAAAVREGLAARWGTGHPVYEMLTGPALRRGRITLTHHGDRAAFRSIRVRELR